MTGLREAFEKLAGEMEYDSSDGGAKIRALLAAHPVEPATQPSDAAVEAAAEALLEAGFVDPDDGTIPQWHEENAPPWWTHPSEAVKVALKAAYRVDVPRPLLDREQLAITLRAHTLFPADEVETRETCACGWRPTGNPMLAYSDHARHVRDAVMELARPMPTQAELTKWLREIFIGVMGGTPYGAAAEELLALLNGPGVDSSLHTCPGCGVKVVGNERCGDPTRPGCAS